MQQTRTFIQTAVGINLVVEAGAGTGKTTAMIERLCICVLGHHIAIERIVALTFTEKAAAEIKTKFTAKLQALIEEIRTGKKKDEKQQTLEFLQKHFQVKNEDLLARAEAALARLDRAAIGTIHGFCADILKVFPLEAGLSPSAQIDSGSVGKQLFEKRWNHFLDEQLGEHAPQPESWKEVLAEIKLADLKTFALQLCSGKIENYDYNAAREMLIPLCREKMLRAHDFSTCFLPAKTAPRTLEKQMQWAAASLKRSLAYLEGKPLPPAVELGEEAEKKASCVKGWEKEDFDEAVSIYQFACKLVPEKQHVFQTAYYLIKDLCQTVRQDYQQTGLLYFDDLIVKTRNLLRDCLDVRRILKEKFDVLFIDEFQDTDPVQGEIMLFLAEEKISSASRWQDVKLEPGKLFVVGDPKQSIYRFRGADITAYQLFTDLILSQGGKKCFLQNNFRSLPEIVDTANCICQRAMVQSAGFQPEYVPIFTSKTQRNQAVNWLFITADNEKEFSVEQLRHNQAEQIARWIEKQVAGEKLADGTPITYKHFAILMYAGTDFPLYAAALRRYGIPFTVEGDKDFFCKQEIDDFLNFLQAVANPQDRIALTGVLRSPLGGMSDEELFQLAKRGELSIYAKTSHPRAQFCYQLIHKFAHLAGRVSAYELVQAVLNDTFLPEVCALAYEGETTLSNLRRLLKLVEPAEQGGVWAASFFAKLREDLKQTPELITLPRTEEAANGVSLLTIHKSKGLEFPIVILADLTKQGGNNSSGKTTPIFSWQYNMYGLRVGAICDLNRTLLEEEQKKHAQCEEVRVMYVALTRAREKMLLVGDNRTKAEKATLPFKQVGLFPQAKQDIIVRENLTIPVMHQDAQKADVFRFTQHIKEERPLSLEGLSAWREQYDKRAKDYEQFKQIAQTQTPSVQAQDNRLLSPAQQQAAQLGTVCHRALEILLTQKEIPVLQAVEQAASQLEASSRLAEVLAIVEPFVNSSLFAQIRATKLLACELPFSFVKEQGQVVSGTLDTLLEISADTLWVIDYKTDRISAVQDPKIAAEKYRPQLQIYQQAVQKLFPQKQVRCSVIFMRTFAVVDL